MADTCGYGEGLSGSINAGNFLTSLLVSLSRRTLLHGVSKCITFHLSNLTFIQNLIIYYHNSVYINIIFITALKPTTRTDCTNHSKLHIVLTSDIHTLYFILCHIILSLYGKF